MTASYEVTSLVKRSWKGKINQWWSTGTHAFSSCSYAIIRAQLGIKGELEMDMVNLIRTFRFADATMVVLDSSQTFMFSLVLFKALVPLVLNSEVGWEEDFELCCRQIGQTSEMVDACVRVLKVAST